jgi:hypothetical protein
VVQQSLLFFTRFRARPEFDAQGVCIGWQEAPAPEQIRVEDHITEHRVQNKAAERALVEKLSVAPIRTDRPYWELHLVTVDQGTQLLFHFLFCLNLVYSTMFQ